MPMIRPGAVAVIFASTRNRADEGGYAEAAAAMETLAARQPGYLDFESARGAEGFGITVSYWADEACAVAWRDQIDHAAIRDLGRDRWYESYRVVVSRVERSYDWARGG